MIDLDRELAERSFTSRERITFRLLFLLIELVYPAKYGHQFDKVFEAIKKDLEK